MKKIGMLLGSILLWSIEASAQTPYFQGKTIRVVVGYPAGSAHDLWARLIAPQLTKHIPGNPATVVQNMPGAGSMTATNYIYSVAKPDGLTLGVNNAALYFEQLLKKKEVQYDWAKFTWVGSTTPTSPLVVYVGEHTLQNHPRRAHGDRAAEVRRDRHGQHRLLSAEIARRDHRREVSNRHRL